MGPSGFCPYPCISFNSALGLALGLADDEPVFLCQLNQKIAGLQLHQCIFHSSLTERNKAIHRGSLPCVLVGQAVQEKIYPVNGDPIDPDELQVGLLGA